MIVYFIAILARTMGGKTSNVCSASSRRALTNWSCTWFPASASHCSAVSGCQCLFERVAGARTTQAAPVCAAAAAVLFHTTC